MTINECAMQKFINLIAICYWKREIYASGARTAGAMESILGVMPPPLPNTQTDNSDTMFWSPPPAKLCVVRTFLYQVQPPLLSNVRLAKASLVARLPIRFMPRLNGTCISEVQ